VDYHPLDPRVMRDPYPYYAELRANAPVYQVPSSGLRVVSRYRDVLFALRHPELFSSAPMAGGGGVVRSGSLASNETLIASDPPLHTGLRRRVDAVLTPRRIRDLESLVARTAEELAAGLAERRECDFVADLAAPLPGEIMAELLGIEPVMRAEFRRWSRALVRQATGRVAAAERAAVDAAVTAMVTHLRTSIEARVARPGDDLLSGLLRGDDPLSPDQVLNVGTLLVVAGNETSTNLIGNAMLALLAQPLEIERARRDEGLADLVEETLRHDSPVQGVLRRAAADVELGDVTIPRGAAVLLLVGSANRDERVFPDGERFRCRGDSHKHLAFGAGTHFCLGAFLARMEARHALRASWARCNFRPTEREIARVDSFLLRGPSALPLTCDPA